MTITTAQLELRRKYLGSSDVAAILGCHPYRSAADVQLEKLGRLEDLDLSDEEAVDVGTDSEPYTVEWAARKLGAASPRDAACTETFLAANGVMCSHPDGLLVSDDGAEPIEGKYSGRIDEFGQPGENIVPAEHYVQLMSHMICVRSKHAVNRGHIAAFLPTYKHRRRLYTFGWNQETADLIETTCSDWWSKHIDKQEPVSVPPSLEVARRIRFRGAGTTAPVDAALAAQYCEMTRQLKEIGDARDVVRAQIESQLDGAEQGECEGFNIKNPLLSRKSYTVAAGDYRRLTIKPW